MMHGLFPALCSIETTRDSLRLIISLCVANVMLVIMNTI